MSDAIPLTDRGIAIANTLYAVLPNFPDEEMWNTSSKMRGAANDLLFYIAQAEGDSDTANTSYDWSRVTKSIAGLIALCRFSIKQKFVSIEPSTMVELEDVLKIAKHNYKQAKDQETKNEQDSMQNWTKKYKIWKETEL